MRLAADRFQQEIARSIVEHDAYLENHGSLADALACRLPSSNPHSIADRVSSRPLHQDEISAGLEAIFHFYPVGLPQ